MNAILIGNGMTSQIIKEYSNHIMMSRIESELSDLVIRLNDYFEVFRLPIKELESYSIGTGICGSNKLGSMSLNRQITGIKHNNLVKVKVLNHLSKLGFENCEEQYEKFFIRYGLIYETQNQRITSLENILKAVLLFSRVKLFTHQEYEKIKKVATNVYHNNGNCTIESVLGINLDKFKEYMSRFELIFTTNYDLVLDTLLMDKDVLHIHGGFNYTGRNKKEKHVVNPDEAYLVWGSNSEEKESQINSSLDYGNIDFGNFNYGGSSLLHDYIVDLRTKQFSDIHVFGYSGENDNHINEAIRMNHNIERIIFYVNPKRLNNAVDRFKIREVLQLDESDNRLELRSWNEVWSQIRL